MCACLFVRECVLWVLAFYHVTRILWFRHHFVPVSLLYQYMQLLPHYLDSFLTFHQPVLLLASFQGYYKDLIFCQGSALRLPSPPRADIDLQTFCCSHFFSLEQDASAILMIFLVNYFHSLQFWAVDLRSSRSSSVLSFRVGQFERFLYQELWQ